MIVMIIAEPYPDAPAAPPTPPAQPSEPAPQPSEPAQASQASQTSEQPSEPAQASQASQTSEQPSEPQREQPRRPRHYIPPGVMIPDPELLDDNIQEMMEMGFSEQDAHRALLAAYNNIARAVDLVTSGNVPQLPLEPEQRRAPRPMGRPQAEGQAAPPGRQAMVAVINEDIPRGRAEQEQLRNNFLAHPREHFAVILHHISETDQELAAAIERDPGPLLALCGVPCLRTETGAEIVASVRQRPPGQQGPPAFGDISPQERLAIQRLSGLGFDPIIALQVLRACGGDENLAAEVLFSMENRQ